MAVLTTPELISTARLLAQDNDDTTPFLEDADWLRLLNETYTDYMAEVDNSIVQLGTVVVDTGGATPNVGSKRYKLIQNIDSNIGSPRKFLRASESAGTSGAGVALERLEVPEIIALRAAGGAGIATTGYPRFWALEKSATRTADHAAPDWYIHLFPDSTVRPGAASRTFYFYGEAHPIPLDSFTVLQPGVSEAESRWLARMTAARGAALIGRSPDFIQAIMRDVPKNIQLGQRISGQYLKPRVRPGEEPV